MPGLETSVQEEEEGGDRLGRDHGCWELLSTAAQDPAERWLPLSFSSLPTPCTPVIPLLLSASLLQPQWLLQGIRTSQQHPIQMRETESEGTEAQSKDFVRCINTGPGPAAASPSAPSRKDATEQRQGASG